MGEGVIIGVILRAHGVQGQVRALATGPTLAGLDIGERVQITDRTGHIRQLELAERRRAGDGWLLRFAGLASRDAVAGLHGATVSVDEARLPGQDADGEFYVRELIGCAVWVDARQLGTVHDVLSRPANDVLEVTTATGTVLVPFTRDAVAGLDVDARRITIRAGLLPAIPQTEDAGAD